MGNGVATSADDEYMDDDKSDAFMLTMKMMMKVKMTMIET